MSLPYVIEYLLTLERPGGGRLVYEGSHQLFIPIFPPGVTISLTTEPFGSDFAFISYYMSFGPAMVPQAFYWTGEQYGNKTYEGLVTSWVSNNQIDYYVPVTKAFPSRILITNRSPLNQLYDGVGFFIAISSEDDYALVMKALARMGTSAKSEQLAVETNQLLRAMAQASGAIVPQPPIQEAR